MKITLNSINAVTGIITNDEPLRQGNVGANTLTAVFEGKSNLAYTATFNYTRSDDGRLKDIPMTPTANAGEYYYKFSNPWFFAVYGETTLTVYLKNSANEIVASGQITFPIEQTDFDDDPNITYSEYELLLDALTAKQNKFEIYNVRGYDSLALAEADDDLDEYQIVIVRGNPTKIYQKGGGELHPLDSVGAYLPLSGGTMSGAISQPVAPVVDDDLANKKYVDDEVAPVAEDIAHILDGSLTVHQAYHTYMDIYGRNLVDLAKTSDLTDGTITVDKATKDANGNVIPTYYQPKLTFDDTPTTSSTKPVTSDGIKSFVDGRVPILDSYQYISELIDACPWSTLTKGSHRFGVADPAAPSVPCLVLKSINDGRAVVISGNLIEVYKNTSGTWTKESNYVNNTNLGILLATKQNISEKGQANGYASLDSGGKVPSTQLPAYVDDILEFANFASFPATGTSGIIYVALDTNLTYRWSGSGYTEISPSLALGETSATAYRGDMGKTAYDHSQLVSGNPHSVTKSDVGLGNVINPNEYNNIGVSTDLDTITISGTYTCYGNANGVPSADYSWFILHLNSGVGTAYAKQIAFAYDGKIYVRFKSTTWGAWAFIPANTLGFDNTIKNLLEAENVQDAIDEVSEKVADIEAVIPANATASDPLITRSDAVKIMPAPASTTLTDDEVAQIINGVHINGTFLGYLNPVFFPARVTASDYYGMFNGADETTVAVEAVYIINKTTKVITRSPYSSSAFTGTGRTLIQISALNSATFPATNPSGTEPYDLTIANGVYSFRERIYEYANMYLSNNATAISLTADTLTKFAIPMTGGASSGVTISTADDNLTILKTGVYQVIITFNTSVSVNDLTLEAGVYKNISTAIPELKQIRTAKNASTIDTSTLQGIVSLTANDVIDVRVKADGNCDMTVINATISVRRIS